MVVVGFLVLCQKPRSAKSFQSISGKSFLKICYYNDITMYSTFTELQDLFPQILAIGHVTTVSRSLKFRIRGRVVWLKSFFRNKNTLAQLHWAKTNFFWHDTKGYGHKNNNAHYQKNTKPACGTRWWQDHSLGLFYFNTKPSLIQGYAAYKNLQIIVRFGISRLLTKENLCDLKLKRTCVMREDSGPKHTSMSTSEWLLKIKDSVLWL